MDQEPNPRRRRDQPPEEEKKQSQPHSEAEEAKEVFSSAEEEVKEEDEGEGEDLLENIERDYRRIDQLDRYEPVGIDEEQYSSMDEEAKQAAELELERQDLERQAFQRRAPLALQQDFLEIQQEQAEINRFLLHRQRGEDLGLMEEEEDEMEDEEGIAEDDKKFLDFEEARGKLQIWIKESRTVKWIRKSFRRFLTRYTENNRKIYEERIREMCENNLSSIEITFIHLAKSVATLGMWVMEEPALILPFFNQVAFEVANQWYQKYWTIQPEIRVKIRDYTANDNLRDLRQKHLNTLIRIQGVVTKRSQVFSQLKKIYYICEKCGDRKGPIYQTSLEEVKLGACAVCQSTGPFKIDHEYTVYRNYQKLTVQETPGTIPPGRIPRHKEVILQGDNIDVARPGDEVIVTGIYTNKYDYLLNVKYGFPIFSTAIEANYVKPIHELTSTDILPEEVKQIRLLSKNANISRVIINSIAPSIFSHYHIKTAIALSMFGGVAKQSQESKHFIRGDINVLVLGDPGTAKSQFLKYIETAFPRSIYTTGKGASAVGLTASVHKDFRTKEWVLEGGALVLADKGICLIDEFDKMNDSDRTSIHEAMEQQSISISKAGIVANLQARCAVIAAANPNKGRYNSQLAFPDNVDLSDPILSRFDVLCVVRDEVDEDNDLALAAFVINNHIKNHPEVIRAENREEKEKAVAECLLEERVAKLEQVPQDLLKKYIQYARLHVKPKITNIDREKITKFYTDLRKEAQVSGGISITVRHLESLIRMTEAHAKMHLRDIVRDDDVDVAISVLLESFIQSQKYSVARNIRKKFAHYLTFRDDNNSVLMHILNKLANETMHCLQFMQPDKQIREIKVSIESLKNEARMMNIYEQDIENFLTSQEFQQAYQFDKQTIIRRFS